MLKISVMVWYEINQSYIATELCEKKEVVANDCQGNCKLSAKLQLTQQETSDDMPFTVSQIEVLTFLVPSKEAYVFEGLGELSHFSGLTCEETVPFVDDIFHPPAIC